MTFEEIAKEVYGAFTTGTRDTGESFVKLRADAPEWLDDVIGEIHGFDMLPDDWRYSVIRSAALEYWEADSWDWDDVPSKVGDDACDVYTARIAHWGASNLDRFHAAEEALAEGTADTIESAIQRAQYEEAYGIAERLASAIDAREETLESLEFTK